MHFWGEDPTGQWTLEIENAGAKDATADGVLKRWQLVLYGTWDNPKEKEGGQAPAGGQTGDGGPGGAAADPSGAGDGGQGGEGGGQSAQPDASPTPGPPRERLTNTGCDDECLGGCYGPGPAGCHSCKNFVWRGQCTKACPEGSYVAIRRERVSAHRRVSAN